MKPTMIWSNKSYRVVLQESFFDHEQFYEVVVEHLLHDALNGESWRFLDINKAATTHSDVMNKCVTALVAEIQRLQRKLGCGVPASQLLERLNDEPKRTSGSGNDGDSD